MCVCVSVYSFLSIGKCDVLFASHASNPCCLPRSRLAVYRRVTCPAVFFFFL